jgi:hypothetical protein
MNAHHDTIIAWLDRRLSVEEVQALEQTLTRASGVKAARIRIKVPHVVVLQYDPEDTSCGILLDCIRRQGVHAHLMVA